MDECELIVFISTLACSIAKCYSDDELSLIAATFTQLGDSLTTILAKRDICNKNSDIENDT